jgi:Ca-activated chloride channel family protein
MKAIAVIFCLGMLLLVQNTLLGQTDSSSYIFGFVRDQQTQEGLGFVGIKILQNRRVVGGATSSQDGQYKTSNLAPGTYTLECITVGYQKYVLENIRLGTAVYKKIDIPLQQSSHSTQMVEIQAYKEPLIGINRRNIVRPPTQNVSTNQYGYGLQVRGNRSTDNTGSYFGKGLSGKENDQEEYARMEEGGFKKARREPLSTFSIDVDRASYSNIRRMLNEGTLPPSNAVRIEEMINYFEYDYPKPSGEHPFSIQTEHTICPWNKKRQLVHIGIQGRKIENQSMPPNNLVFLIDVSGSMDEPKKLPLVKSSLGLLVKNMRKEDRIAIVVYAGAAGQVLPSTSGSEKQKILDALENLSAGGSTAGGAGIELAYKIAKENFLPEGNNRIVLATDGDFNVGVQSASDLEELISQKRQEKVYLSVLGFGTGNLKDERMETLADKGNGNFAYIDNLLEAHKVLVKEMAGTLLTIARDVKIQVEFNPAFVKKYRLVGYENRVLADRDFNDDTKDAGELGSGHTVTALYEIVPEGAQEESGTQDSVDALKYQTVNPLVPKGKELFTLKMRYKMPADSISKLLVHVQPNEPKSLEQASENCLFASSVAAFGMVLRKSKYQGNSTFQDVMKQAQRAKGEYSGVK